MYLRRLAMARSLPVSVLVFWILVLACSTQTVPTDPLEPASPPGRILGQVTEDGEPVSGIAVTLSRIGSQVATVITTGNGEFGFTGLDAGTYTVAIPQIASLHCSRLLAAKVVPGETAAVNFHCVTPTPSATPPALCNPNWDYC